MSDSLFRGAFSNPLVARQFLKLCRFIPKGNRLILRELGRTVGPMQPGAAGLRSLLPLSPEACGPPASAPIGRCGTPT
jgi:hypothetical protein